MKIAFISVLISSVISVGSSYASESIPYQRQITLTTFNVKWFGLIDPESDKSVEDQIKENSERSIELKKFIRSELKSSQVIAFQEIVDTAELKSLLPFGWTCSTYDHQSETHQHVMICASQNFKLERVPYDNNNIIEDVTLAFENSRPAVRVDVLDRNNRRLIRVAAVHLKAAPHFSKTREAQILEVGKDLKLSNSTIPTVLMGDMNSYPKNLTKRDQDDLVIFERTMKKTDTSFRSVDLKDKHTFRSEKTKGQYDHVFINKNLKVVGTPKIFEVCNQSAEGEGYLNHKFYSTMISDHCPLTVTVQY